MIKRRSIVNCSTAKYHAGQQRLADSLKGKDLFATFIMSEAECLAPLHTESMYAFKPYSFIMAKNMGDDVILWLDASMYVIKDLSPIFEQIERDGYFFQDSGWLNSQFMTDEAREYFGTDKGRMISSGVLGIDFTNPIGHEFFNRWFKSCEDGMFNGSHDNWRHDQSCASLIIEQMGLKITNNDTFWQYGKVGEPVLHDGICIIADGVC